MACTDEKLIVIIDQYHVLYDFSHKDYNVTMQVSIWEEISGHLNESGK